VKYDLKSQLEGKAQKDKVCHVCGRSDKMTKLKSGLKNIGLKTELYVCANRHSCWTKFLKGEPNG